MASIPKQVSRSGCATQIRRALFKAKVEAHLMDQFTLQLLAQTGAWQEALVNLYAYKLLEEPDPIGAANTLKDMFASSPTIPPRQGTKLDPATSDLLAAMTDEALQDLFDRVIGKLEHLTVSA